MLNIEYCEKHYPELKQHSIEYTIDLNRPYNVEKRRLESLVNFRVISKSRMNNCLIEFISRLHKTALIINKEVL